MSADYWDKSIVSKLSGSVMQQLFFTKDHKQKLEKDHDVKIKPCTNINVSQGIGGIKYLLWGLGTIIEGVLVY